VTTLAEIQCHVGVTPDGKWGPATAFAIAKALGMTEKLRALAHPGQFFTSIRNLTGALDQTQVDSINAILREGAAYPLSHVAYFLATAWHEARFKPQEEWGKGKGRPYAKPGKYSQSQHGRGLVQLTWDRNYEWADKRFGLNGALLKDFNKALEPDLAAKVLVIGMAEGAFGQKVGKTLPADDSPANHTQFRLARPSVNVMDKADMIADYALRFQAAILAGGWG
jgi:putative chitinase